MFQAVLAAFAVLAAPAHGAEAPEFTPELQVRPRLEVDTGEDGAEGGERFFVVQRSRLGLRGTMGSATARVVIQDARLWGSEANTAKVTAEELDLRIAEVRLQLGEGTSMTVGRQELKWHEQRLLAIAYWLPVGRVFDAARIDVERGAFHLQGFGAITGEGDSATVDGWAADEDAWTAGLLTGAQTAGLLVDGIYLADWDLSADRRRHTTGIYAKASGGILEGRVEAYAQLGSTGDDAIRAGMVGIYGSVAPELRWSPKITLWYDLLSGDATPKDGVASAFDMVYGAKHKFMGVADIAYFQVGGYGDGQGLHNPAIKLQVSPAEGRSVNLDGHFFLAAAPQTADAVLGQEIDLYGAWGFSPRSRLAAGAGAFQGTDERPMDLFGWVQLDLNY